MCRSAWWSLAFLALAIGPPPVVGEGVAAEMPEVFYFPGANSRPTYFSVHNVLDAWTLSRGRGVKVGILDHSFGFRVHPNLYAGGRNF